MDYLEFKTKANADVTKEEYERIQYVYMYGPHNIVGGFVTEFCKWYNSNGGMRAVDAMYPFIEAAQKSTEKIKGYVAKIEELNRTIDRMSNEIEVYRSIVDEDDLMEQIEKRASRDDLIRFISEMGA